MAPAFLWDERWKILAVCLSHPQQSFAGQAWPAVGLRNGEKSTGGVFCGEVPGRSSPILSCRMLRGLIAGHR